MLNFDDTLEIIPDGYMLYSNLTANLEILLDNASRYLSEEDYEEFRKQLKEFINEDL